MDNEILNNLKQLDVLEEQEQIELLNNTILLLDNASKEFTKTKSEDGVNISKNELNALTELKSRIYKIQQKLGITSIGAVEWDSLETRYITEYNSWMILNQQAIESIKNTLGDKTKAEDKIFALVDKLSNKLMDKAISAFFVAVPELKLLESIASQAFENARMKLLEKISANGEKISLVEFSDKWKASMLVDINQIKINFDKYKIDFLKSKPDAVAIQKFRNYVNNLNTYLPSIESIRKMVTIAWVTSAIEDSFYFDDNMVGDVKAGYIDLEYVASPNVNYKENSSRVDPLFSHMSLQRCSINDITDTALKTLKEEFKGEPIWNLPLPVLLTIHFDSIIHKGKLKAYGEYNSNKTRAWNKIKGNANDAFLKQVLNEWISYYATADKVEKL